MLLQGVIQGRLGWDQIVDFDWRKQYRPRRSPFLLLILYAS